MTDSELRTVKCQHYIITKSTTGVPGTMWQECELCGTKLKDIYAAIRAAERTAIKAALPEKLPVQWGGTSNVVNYASDKDAVNHGYNQALTEVTQVIDGREG